MPCLNDQFLCDNFSRVDDMISLNFSFTLKLAFNKRDYSQETRQRCSRSYMPYVCDESIHEQNNTGKWKFLPPENKQLD